MMFSDAYLQYIRENAQNCSRNSYIFGFDVTNGELAKKVVLTKEVPLHLFFNNTCDLCCTVYRSARRSTTRQYRKTLFWGEIGAGAAVVQSNILNELRTSDATSQRHRQNISTKVGRCEAGVGVLFILLYLVLPVPVGACMYAGNHVSGIMEQRDN